MTDHRKKNPNSGTTYSMWGTPPPPFSPISDLGSLCRGVGRSLTCNVAVDVDVVASFSNAHFDHLSLSLSSSKFHSLPSFLPFRRLEGGREGGCLFFPLGGLSLSLSPPLFCSACSRQPPVHSRAGQRCQLTPPEKEVEKGRAPLLSHSLTCFLPPPSSLFLSLAPEGMPGDTRDENVCARTANRFHPLSLSLSLLFMT